MLQLEFLTSPAEIHHKTWSVLDSSIGINPGFNKSRAGVKVLATGSAS